MQNLHEAKNMALKAGFMLHERRSYGSFKKNYGGENLGHLFTKEWQFERHCHIMIDKDDNEARK